jgi:hypothetical protein
MNTGFIPVGRKRELPASGRDDAKMASNPSSREDFMIQQHGKLLQIHHRLKTMAEEQGIMPLSLPWAAASRLSEGRPQALIPVRFEN